MRETIAALVPIAGQALLASLRAAMRERVDEVVPTAFSTGAPRAMTGARRAFGLMRQTLWPRVDETLSMSRC